MRFLGSWHGGQGVRVRRSALAVGIGVLGSVAFLLDCGGSSFSGASGGTSAVGAGAGGIAQGGVTAAGGASGGKAGASTRGGASAGGSSGRAQGGGSEAGEPPSAGAGGVSEAGAGGVDEGGSSGEPTSVCPAAAPTSGSCVSGLTCTYGGELRPDCRARYDCVKGAWSASRLACSAVTACADRDAGVPQVGTACTDVGDDCTLNGGAATGVIYCRCDQNLDTGTDALSSKWDCVGPPPSPCPQLFPNLGQACDTNGQSCTYGACNIPTYSPVGVQCEEHVWTQVAGGCVSAG